jgi:hypothetical protein
VEELVDKKSTVKLQLGGMNVKTTSGGDYTMEQLQTTASNKLLKKERRRKKPLSKTMADSFAAADVMDHDFNRAVIRGGYDALGNMLRDKRLNAKFKEKALIEGGFIGTSADQTFIPNIKKVGVSSHESIRIGNTRIMYSFDTDFVLLLPDTISSTFSLRNLAGLTISEYEQFWHPYYSQPLNVRCLLAFTGIHGGDDRLRIKSHMGKFSPSHFRRDLMPEHVMHGIDRVRKENGNVREYLKFVGFTSEGDNNEVEAIMQHIHKMGLYRDLSVADEYSSVFDVVKSCSTRQILDLISKTSTAFYNLLTSVDSEVRGVVLTHYIGLLCDEMNVAAVHRRSTDDDRNFIRIPTVKIDVSI